jgi:hypothetical protein
LLLGKEIGTAGRAAIVTRQKIILFLRGQTMKLLFAITAA